VLRSEQAAGSSNSQLWSRGRGGGGSAGSSSAARDSGAAGSSGRGDLQREAQELAATLCRQLLQLRDSCRPWDLTMAVKCCAQVGDPGCSWPWRQASAESRVSRLSHGRPGVHGSRG
jgi:hypothetical protein